MKHYKDLLNTSYKLKRIMREAVLKTSVDIDTDAPTDEQILRISIASELSAINLYQQLAEVAESDSLKKVLLDITNEEKIHIGEFESLLREYIDSEDLTAYEDGAKEIQKII
jgi:rubrerythrin